jgi:hypothetical protein
MSHSKSSHSKSLTTKRKKQRDKKRLANVAKRAKKAGKKA